MRQINRPAKVVASLPLPTLQGTQKTTTNLPHPTHYRPELLQVILQQLLETGHSHKNSFPRGFGSSACNMQWSPQ